jgi:cobalamin-dependent methionine synthase I
MFRDVEWARGSISFVRNSIIFKSQVITELLEHCHQVAVFLVTIGEYLEETAYQLAKDGLILQATVLDAIGSDAVEKLADFVQDRIREVANTKGLVTSQRFSPGYCDWNIGQQRMLFWALNGNTLGIHLTGECLMIPQKSISGIIGIGPPNGNVENYNPCKTCEQHDCLNKR